MLVHGNNQKQLGTPEQMNRPLTTQQVQHAPASTATEATQVAALCWRARAGAVQVLMVTSRGTGRWIVPKGWHIDGQDAASSALTEAWEEAGVRGVIMPEPVGIFSYVKLMEDGSGQPIMTTLFAVRVRTLVKTWPEMSERRRRWMSPRKAATRVAEPELAALLLGFGLGKRSN